MSKKDIADALTVAVVGLCCPFAILFPPFSDLVKEKQEESGNE